VYNAGCVSVKQIQLWKSSAKTCVTCMQGAVAKFLELFLGYQSGPLQAHKWKWNWKKGWYAPHLVLGDDELLALPIGKSLCICAGFGPGDKILAHSLRWQVFIEWKFSDGCNFSCLGWMMIYLSWFR